jgi:cell division protein FtsZ
MGILTVGIVTVPFGFEGRKRRQQAEEGLDEMRKNVDTLLVINNERLREISGNLTIGNAFSQADDVLAMAAKGIAEVISVTGNINVDFNDVNTVMKNSGVAIMGSACAGGENRAIEAVQHALSSPLLNDNDISGAKYVLLNITYGDNEVLMDEITAITDFIQDEAGSTADVIWGHGYDATLGEQLSVTIIATGFNSAPITGFEKAPARIVRPLEDEPKNEIVRPLESPTQVNTYTPVSEQVKAEPFLKKEEEVVSFASNQKEIIAPLTNNLELSDVFTDPFIKKEEVKQEELLFEDNSSTQEWEIETPTSIIEEKVEVKKYDLESPIEDRTIELNTRTVLSNEEQQKRAAERISRIQEYTQKLKKADGISEFEKEPAYVRQNIQLDNYKYSTENKVSRFGVSTDENGTTLRGNNSFLHDNVD